MKRVLAGMCVALLLFAPVEQLVADTLDISLKDPIVITTSPLSPIVGYGVFTPGATPGDFTGEVATSERLVRMRAERGTIITEDGYSLQVLLLQNDADVMLVQFIGRDPSGKAVHAYMRGLRSKGHVENAGLSELRQLLSRSADFAVLRSVVPDLATSPTIPTRKIGSHDQDLSCEASVIGMFAAALGAVATCGEVEMTGDILGCFQRLLALVATMVAVYNTCDATWICGGPDGECPTMDEPPACTSYTIC